MKKKLTGFIVMCLSAISLLIAGCGGGSAGAPAASTSTVSGVAAAGLPLVGTAYLKDSSIPAKELTAPIGAGGSFSFDVSGMQAPFILQAVGTANGTSHTLHSFTGAPGTANINPMSNVAVAVAGGVTDPATMFTTPDPATLQKCAAALPAAISALQTQLMPLLNLYGAASVNPIAGNYVANSTGLDAMFDAVNMGLSAGVVTVMNRTSNAMIFSAPVNNISGGTFNMGNMPAPTPVPTPVPTPTPAPTWAMYNQYCSGCHGTSVRARTVAQVQAAIAANFGGMGSISLSATQIAALLAGQ